MSEEYENAIANGKYIIKTFDFREGSIGYYKVYSMINLIEKQQNQIKKLNIENQKLFEEIIEVTKERDELKEKNNNQRWLIRQLDKENIIPDIDSKILDYISKDKMRWKPISEYDTKKYDWVLVKYYDGDFECVPVVAEQRNRKWFSRDDIEISFEVKYFFDMQELLGEEDE